VFEVHFDDDTSLPWYPDLEQPCFHITSEASGAYNCIGWVLDSTDAYIWPTGGLTDAGVEWPDGVPREVTIPAFVALFVGAGFEQCLDDIHEDGYIKIVLYAINHQEPTHAAREIPGGKWTSKFGDRVDARHDSVDDLNSRVYGRAVAYFRRAV
jgi:hypothetical protein